MASFVSWSTPFVYLSAVVVGSRLVRFSAALEKVSPMLVTTSLFFTLSVMFPVIDERESFADSIALVYVSGFVSVLAAEERLSVIALSVSESFSVSIAVLSESAVVVAKSFRPLDNEPKMLSKSVLVSESAAFERFEKSFA